ncbi:MAG: hypothetical protein AAGC55_33325, partial [Myxococcota bacterium]
MRRDYSLRLVLFAIFAAIVGCTFDPQRPGASPSDAGAGEDAGDGSSDAVPCANDILDFTPSNFDDCDLAAPGAALELGDGSWTLNSDSGAISGTSSIELSAVTAIPQSDAPILRVYTVDSFTLAAEATLRIEGQAAIAIVSAGDITIDGVISVAGLQAGTGNGAGGGDALYCGVGGAGVDGQDQTDTDGDVGGSGGSGAGFGDAGGPGGRSSPGKPITNAGSAGGTEQLEPLRGGCLGGSGGGVAGAGTGGMGGGAGGAIQLVAANALALSDSAAITARGGAGGGGAGGD